jgi:hypothetical protein
MYMELQMKRFLMTGTAALLMLGTVTACNDRYDPGQRAAGGALIGAGTGAAIGGIAGGGSGAAVGALAGGATGAAVGAATTPPRPRDQYGPPPPPPGY